MKILIPAIAVDVHGNRQEIVLEADLATMCRTERRVSGTAYVDEVTFEFVEVGDFDAMGDRPKPKT